MKAICTLVLFVLCASFAAATSFSQMIEDNLKQLQQEGGIAPKAMATANQGNCPQRLCILSHTAGQAREEILVKFPVGTSAAHILRVFPAHFALIDAKADEQNGVFIKGHEGAAKQIGTRSLRLTVDKQWPAGIAPFVQYRFVDLAFNADGELLDVQVVDAMDAL